MKIAILGTHRSRSSALQQYLLHLHSDHEDLFEYYAPSMKEWQTNYLQKRRFINNSEVIYKDKLTEVTNKLQEKNNFVVKILGQQFKEKLDNNFINCLQLQNYDELHLIERHDFFEQCCSIQISLVEDIWLQVDFSNTENGINQEFISRAKIDNKKYDTIITKNKKYTVEKIAILRQILDVYNYLSMKEYIISNNLPYTLHNYKDEKFESGKQIGLFKKINLDYSTRINNYAKKNQINALFAKYFNYDSCNRNLEDFTKEINLLF